MLHTHSGCDSPRRGSEDCLIIEASTNHFNDRVRCEELYGHEPLEGLPTTSEEEIIEK